jgi:hypothetical protein
LELGHFLKLTQKVDDSAVRMLISRLRVNKNAAMQHYVMIIRCGATKISLCEVHKTPENVSLRVNTLMTIVTGVTFSMLAIPIFIRTASALCKKKASVKTNAFLRD